MNTTKTPSLGWLAHDDSNKVQVFYIGDYDTEKGEVRELTKLIRRGLTLRLITDDGVARGLWGDNATEAQLKACTAPPTYDLEDGSATSIAEKLVADRRERQELRAA